MVLKTNNKFKNWDIVEKEQYFEKDKHHIRYALGLLSDSTIYMYAFFRYKNERMRLYQYKDLIVNDSSKRIIFTGSNQLGKSICLCCKAGFVEGVVLFIYLFIRSLFRF